jgi:RNA polymerase sigma-70 factor (ECF subfamily)
MDEPRADRSLLDLWRAGDEKAAGEIVQRYLDRLLALARRHMDQRLASRVDPEDIVQSVFRTFFLRAREGQFTLEDPDGLFKLLARITLHKTFRQTHFHRAAKRDLHLEAGSGPDSPQLIDRLFDEEPSPDAVHAFVDQLEHFLGRLDPLQRQVLELRMQGCGTGEIARRLGTYDRKVARLLERIRAQAEEEDLTPQGGRPKMMDR